MKVVRSKVVIRADMLKALDAIMLAQQTKNPALAAKQARLLEILRKQRSAS